MKIKIQPSWKIHKKHTMASKFTRFIRLLSNVYILPLEYKNDFKEVKFSLLSLKSLASTMVTTTQFLFAIIWFTVFQWDFTSHFFEKSLHVYHLFDFTQMFAFNVSLMQPFQNAPIILWICKIWTSFPELAQVQRKVFNYLCVFLKFIN